MYSEKECRFSPHHIVGGLIQIFLVFAFLSLFFFLYVVKVERQIFSDQVGFIVDSFVDEFFKNIDVFFPERRQDINKLFSDAVAKFEITENQEVNAAITASNNKIQKTTQITLLVTGVVIILILIAMWYFGGCLDFGRQFAMGLVILAFIAITEFAFLHLVAKNYISAEVNNIKSAILERVQKYAEEQGR